MKLGCTVLSNPVFLAPLAGSTDLPFRNLVTRFGAGLVVSEMIASQELVNGKWATREKAGLGFGIENTSVQLAGRDPHCYRALYDYVATWNRERDRAVRLDRRRGRGAAPGGSQRSSSGSS